MTLTSDRRAVETAAPVLRCTGLLRRFGDRVAVDGVGFVIEPGETYGLLGPNGAGKTTTIRMVCGLLRPDRGAILVAGQPVEDGSTASKGLIGYVPQDIALYPDLTARENLEFFGRLYGLRGRRLRRRVAEVLDLVDLSDRADDRTESFSGGMRRRLNIGAGLVHQPTLLVLDEPTVGVDPQSRNAILESVHRFGSEGMASTGPGATAADRPASSTPSAPTPPAPARPSGQTGGWSAGRVVAVVVGGVLVFTGLGVLGAGGAALWADRVARDEDGFVTSGAELSTPSYALVSERVTVYSGDRGWSVSERLLGDVRVEATSANPAPVFVGIAAAADVRDYLAGVEHATVTEFRDGAPGYRQHPGTAPSMPPDESDIWVAQASSAGTATLEWPMVDGEWTVVMMNADGTRGVDARTEVGATMPFLDWLPQLLLIAGAVLLLLGLGLCIAAVRRRTA